MADGIKGAVGQLAVDVGEAVVKPVVDEVGKALEQGVQNVVSSPKQLTPAQQQQKQQQDAANLAEARRKVKFWQDLAAAQKAVREKQSKQQAQVQQVKANEKKVKQFEVVEKKKALTNVQLEGRKSEIKGRLGG